MGFGSEMSNDRVATKNIFSAGDWLYMDRIHASTPPAQVVRYQTLRKGLDQSLMSYAVSATMLADPPKSSISIAIPITDPLPAGAEIRAIGRGGAELDLRPETGRQTGIAKLRGSGKLWLHRKSPFGVTGSGAQHVAAPI